MHIPHIDMMSAIMAGKIIIITMRMADIVSDSGDANEHDNDQMTVNQDVSDTMY